MDSIRLYQLLLLHFCTIFIFSCNKEPERPQAEISYFMINGNDSVPSNSVLNIEAGCKAYAIQPSSQPEGASVFFAINDHAFAPFQAPILLHDSIRKISAYAIHPEYKKSAISSLNINFRSDIFAGTTALFPNPATDYITYKIENSYRGEIKFTLLDMRGLIQYTTEKEKVAEILEITVDITNFNEGLYVYKLKYEACQRTGKLLVKR